MKFVIVTVVAMLLAGCGDTVVVHGVKRSNVNITTYAVNGKPLECIKMHKRLSCNWDKYKKQRR